LFDVSGKVCKKFRVQGMGSTIRKHNLGPDVEKRWVLRPEIFEREKEEYRMSRISVRVISEENIYKSRTILRKI
jgi:hypothetical protein